MRYQLYWRAPALTSVLSKPAEEVYQIFLLPQLRFPVPGGKFSESLGGSVIAHIEPCKVVKV